MEQKHPRTGKPVKTAPRVGARERRCSQHGKLTAKADGAIIVGAQDEPGAQNELGANAKTVEKPLPDAQAKGCVEVMEMYFDAEGRPIKRKSVGAARVARAYDAQGNQVEEAYFNAEGKPTVPKDVGAARIAWRYDDAGRRVEAAFFGADGAPIRRPGGSRKRIAGSL
jgi:YD repeat-containing protein